MIRVTLPWPPSALNPNNAGGNRYAMARVKKKYREVCCQLAREAGLSWATMQGFDEADVSLMFHQPDRRHRDHDNMIASMKAGLDGLADALGVDDHCFRLTAEFPKEIAGMVKVSVTPGKAKP